MMTLKSTTALICAGLVLAGCGGGGGGDSVTSASPVSAIFPSNFRDPNETEFSALEEGLVYYIGTTEGTVSEFLVRIERAPSGNPNDDRLFVRQDGGPELEFVPLDTSGTSATELRTVFVFNNGQPNELQFQVIADSDPDPSDSTGIFRVNFPAESIGPQNFGRGGLETRVANLPPNSATYEGFFDLDTRISIPDPQGAPGQQQAVGIPALFTETSNTVVDFATNTISGDHAGTSFLGDTDVAVSGRITGSVEGSRIGGSLSVEGGANGSLQFGGLFTGETGNNLVGGVAGTIQQGGENTPVGGQFRLGQTSVN